MGEIVMTNGLTREHFEVRCQWARDESGDSQCTKHVNVLVRVVGGVPVVVDAYVSDWFVDGSTVRTYCNGDERF